MTNELVKLSKAAQMLAEAKTLEEVKHIVAIAEAARVYAKAAKLGLQAYNDAAEVKVRAERKAGEMLAQLDKKQGKRNDLTSSNVDEVNYRTVLREQKISDATAERWQQLAEMLEEEFEWHIEETKGEKPITTSGILREIRAEELEDERAKLAKSGEAVALSERWRIYQGDITTWIAPRQYDFIITDPPYPKEYLPLYEVLARRSVEWLKPGGLLVAMCGHSYLDQIYALMAKHLPYYWTGAYLTLGQPTPLRERNVNTTWKPLLMFGNYNGKTFGDVFVSDHSDKSLHKWGQSESGMLSIVSKLCLLGQYVLDPFCGAGTTGVAALKHGCLFDGLDIDIGNVYIAKARLSDYSKT